MGVPPTIRCSSAKWRRPSCRTPIVNPFCLELRLVASIPRIQRLKTRRALEPAAVEFIGIFGGNFRLVRDRFSYRTWPFGCERLYRVKQRKQAAGQGGLLYAEAQGNESLLEAPQRRNCVPSRDRSANSNIERVHHSNLTGINDRTRVGRRQAVPNPDPRTIGGNRK